jgi:hypothetical protein
LMEPRRLCSAVARSTNSISLVWISVCIYRQT